MAEEASSLGNPTGKSEPRTFVVNTEPPEVTLAAVPTPSNDTTPSFSGTASESLPVTVKVYKGSKVGRLAGGDRGRRRWRARNGAR